VDKVRAFSLWREVIQVEPGTVYCIRMIGGTGLNLVSLAFEDPPELSVMAADARYTKLADMDRIQIASG
jgi:Multicopper oxidase